MVIALILSGGTGSRLGAGIPKQYIEVAGKRIIDYGLDTFEACADVDAIQIVAEDAWVGVLQTEVWKKIKGFSKPGANRQESILNGLEDIFTFASEEDIVIVHDAARPLVTEETLQALLEATQDHDGAIPVLPMKDTVYFSKDGKTIDSLLERKCIYAGQAPESFRLGKYLAANKALSREELLNINGATEPAVLVGMDVVMIPGDERNFKITTKDDLERFREMMKEHLES